MRGYAYKIKHIQDLCLSYNYFIEMKWIVVVIFFLCTLSFKWVTDCSCIMVPSVQGCQWVSRCHTASLEHREWGVFARTSGPPCSRTMCSVWWTPCSKWSVWLHGEGLEPWARRMPTHAPGAHQSRIFPSGNFLVTRAEWSDIDNFSSPIQ